MSGKIDIDCEILESAIVQMKSSHLDFSTITQNGFKNEIEAMDAMNSDFADKFTRVLEISQDWNLKELNDNIVHYIEAAQTIYEEIRKADEALTGSET